MGAWTPITKPNAKYLYEDPNAYSPVDPDRIKAALAASGLSSDTQSSLLSGWSTMMSPPGSSSVSTSPSSAGGAPQPKTFDYRSLIENDPAYKQALADDAAAGVSDAQGRAAAIRRSLISWGLIPDFMSAAGKLGLSPTASGFLSSDVDQSTLDLAAQNEAQGLSAHAHLDKANQDNINAIRNALAARGMYQSGELPYGLEQNAQQYKDASTQAMQQILGQIEDVSGRYSAAERQRQRDLADARGGAADRAVQIAGSSNLSTSPYTTNNTTAGTARWGLPAKTATVWDVNTASTFDAINAAKQSGGGIVIRPDDPESITKANAASQAGVPVSIQVNGAGDDTPQSLAMRVAQYQAQYPGASFTLDLEAPNFRDMTPGKMEAYAQSVQQVAGNTPIIITTEGVSDFNYGAWASNPNVTFAPQAYNGDMSPRDVSQVVALLTSQGIPVDRIVPVIAPGQDVGTWTGPVSVYGAPASGAPAAPAAPPTAPSAAPTSGPVGSVEAAQANATQSASNYSPETVQQILAAVAQAYSNPYMDTTYKSGGMY